MKPLLTTLRHLGAAALVVLASAATPALAQDTVCNTFTGDTLVHVRPQGANDTEALKGKTEKRGIKDLQPGDEVLAYAEWKDKGTSLTDDGQRLDERLSYQKVQEVMIIQDRVRTLVHLSLSDGQKITTTDGHPFKTQEGWRDAILLKKGGKLLLKDGEGDSDHLATIDEVRTEQITVKTFNLEVANAHTFFVGDEGVLVHNAKPGPSTDPNAPHNSAIREIGDLIRKMGGEVLAGGGGRERLIPTPCGSKSGRRPDVLYRDSLGTIRAVNVGKLGRNGRPVPRETAAMSDLNGAGIPTTFVPYNR